MNRKYSKSTFEKLLKRLDKNLDSKVEIIAIGGTALSLTDIRSFTRDIDICYLKCKSPIDFAQIVINSAKEEGINPKDIEMFHGFEMTLLDIPNFSERAAPYKKLNLKNIELKTMDLLDLALSKIHRSYLRDIDDVKKMLNKGKIDLKSLRARYIEVVRYQKDFKVREEFIQKYEAFMKDYL